MIFRETEFRGAYVIDAERLQDDRGFFARTWCRKEFQANGLNPELVQCSISVNAKKGTLRGMHYQIAPFEETKLVRCTMGAIYDVIVDLRPSSPTFKRQLGVTLSADNRRMLYIPEGFLHGFLTLEDNTEVFYQMSEFYAPDHARGFRWNDPAFGIEWPSDVKVISERDRNYSDFSS
ncbi:MAG: dTDP-4-dehydrorhamnose 3,5-epimerase [Proteobacteria bacterium]|nr:dTDP-4-dehydrorhamnose 3,5-epimerase [Pseudomonadota bacterium]